MLFHNCASPQELVTRTVRYLGWGNFNELTNFLKHADRDPGAEIDEASEAAIQIGIGFAAMLYRDITAALTPEMKAFHLWMKVSNPSTSPMCANRIGSSNRTILTPSRS
jgi:hypothetical protein